MNKKIAIIGTVGLPAQYGGFETLAENLVDKLADDYNITVYCSSKGLASKPLHYKGASLVYSPLDANGVQSIPYDIWAMVHAIKKADVLLVLGVSGCVVLPLLTPFLRNKKVIVNIDGLEWKREKWQGFAATFLRFSEKIAVKFADVVVADNQKIQEHVHQSYGKSSELIAYGADHASARPLTESLQQQYPVLKDDYAFSVCRIEPENNIHIILEAMQGVKDFPLVLIGNWQSSDYGQALRRQYANAANLHLLDPIYEQEKLDSIRANCKIYLHGHSAGGTNPSLVEAMYLGLPIMAFDVGYNRETTMGECLYFTDSQALTHLVQSTTGETLLEVAEKMQAIANEHYTWTVIAQRYAELFC